MVLIFFFCSITRSSQSPSTSGLISRESLRGYHSCQSQLVILYGVVIHSNGNKNGNNGKKNKTVVSKINNDIILSSMVLNFASNFQSTAPASTFSHYLWWNPSPTNEYVFLSFSYWDEINKAGEKPLWLFSVIKLLAQLIMYVYTRS